MINIPGHCDGLCAVKITREDGRYVLLFSDGGYATKSWKEMITSGFVVIELFLLRFRIFSLHYLI